MKEARKSFILNLKLWQKKMEEIDAKKDKLLNDKANLKYKLYKD